MFIRLGIWKFFLKEIFTFSPFIGFGAEVPYLHASLEVDATVMGDSYLEYLNFLKIFGPNIHSHNLIIQIFYSFGSFGLVTFILYFGMFCKNLDSRMISSYWITAMSVLSFFVHEIVDYTIADPSSFYLLCIHIGFLSFFLKKQTTIKIGMLYEKLPVFLYKIIYLYIILVTWNLSIFLKQVFALKNHLSRDQIGNFYIPKMNILTDKERRAFERLDDFTFYQSWNSYYFMLKAELEYSSYRQNTTQESALTILDFKKCTLANSNQTFCFFRLSEVYGLTGDLENSKKYSEITKLKDPYGIVRGFSYD